MDEWGPCEQTSIQQRDLVCVFAGWDDFFDSTTTTAATWLSSITGEQILAKVFFSRNSVLIKHRKLNIFGRNINK